MMSLAVVMSTGRYAVVVVGVLGLFTSVQIACTFSDAPPTKSTASNKDAGELSAGDSSAADPIIDAATSDDGVNMRPVPTLGYGYGYGYGYGQYLGTGGYGYGYGYGTYGYGYGYGYGH